jgi:predicted lysophospholipase L1 biosynthesis ABC-type transport system permease subunit
MDPQWATERAKARRQELTAQQMTMAAVIGTVIGLIIGIAGIVWVLMPILSS